MTKRVILSNRVLELGLSGAEFHLIAALASFGDRAFKLSIRQMSCLTGLSTATINRTLPLLEGRRLLFRYAKIKDHRRLANSYRLNIPAPRKKRFFCLPVEAIRELSSNSLMVYAYLICRSGRTKMAYPSEWRIAGDTGLSRTTVRSCTALLEQEGWITKERRNYSNTDAMRSFAYTLHFAPSIDEDVPHICPVCGDLPCVKAITLPDRIVRQTANIGVLRDPIIFNLQKRVFRPPRSP